MRILLTLVGVVFLFHCTQALFVWPTTVSENVGTANFTVEVNATTSVWVFSYETGNVTAVAGTDFVSTSGTVSMSGTNTTVLSIDIIDVDGFQGDRDFLLVLTESSFFSDPIEFTITITDDDTPSVDISSVSNSPVVEGSNITVTISRNDSSTYPFNLTVNTVAVSATPDEDYEDVDSRLVTFDEDEMWVQVVIATFDDGDAEPTETLNITLTGDIDSDETLQVEIKDDDTPVPFHCRRPGQNCANQSAQCSFSEGTCSPCEGDFKGDDCSINPAQITSDCDPECVNGTCLSGTCLCDPGFAGEACDQKAYFVQCNPNNFSVCITPYGDFSGKVFVDGAEDECTLSRNSTEEGIVDWCEGYGAVIPFNGTCGMLGPFNDSQSGRRRFVLRLWVLYNPPYLFGVDENVTFVCSVMNDSSQISSQAFNVVPFDDQVATPNGETVDFTPAVQTVTLESGDLLPNPLPQDVEIVVCVSVEDVDGLNGVQIRRIVFDNRREGDLFDEVLVYEDGCDFRRILFDKPQFVPPDMRHTMCFSFPSFVYDPSDPTPRLGITTFSQLYDNASFAALASCERRKKRDTNLDEGNIVEGHSVSTIYMTAGTSLPQSGGDQTVLTTVGESYLLTECETQWLWPALIGLSVVAVTMAIIIVILSGFTIKRHRDKRLHGH